MVVIQAGPPHNVWILDISTEFFFNYFGTGPEGIVQNSPENVAQNSDPLNSPKFLCTHCGANSPKVVVPTVAQNSLQIVFFLQSLVLLDRKGPPPSLVSPVAKLLGKP